MPLDQGPTRRCKRPCAGCKCDLPITMHEPAPGKTAHEDDTDFEYEVGLYGLAVLALIFILLAIGLGNLLAYFYRFF